MHCTNCGQELPAGAVVCPLCGAPAPGAPAPAVPAAVAGPPLYVQPAPAVLPGASGVSIASLVLGILSILLVVLAVFLTYSLGANIISRFGEGMDVTQEEILRLTEDPAFQSSAIGMLLCFGGSLLTALGGLILGIVGISGEGRRPTQGGKALSIVGLVLSILPLLCCVAVLFLGLLGQGAA